jgi:threonine dehydrogenase-like Zn-dependent dehydrogenase
LFYQPSYDRHVGGDQVKSIVLEAPGRIAMHDAPSPAPPGPGEALVTVRCIGVCGTDLHAYRGTQSFVRYPAVLGHELAVEVLELGPTVPDGAPDDLVPGARCAVLPYLADGTCAPCRAGRSNCCATLRVLGVHVDGGMRDRLLLPRANLLRADDLGDTALALVEMLAVGAHAVRRAAIRADERVLVLGAGPIGLSAMVFATGMGADVATFDLDQRRVDAALRAGVARSGVAGTGGDKGAGGDAAGGDEGAGVAGTADDPAGTMFAGEPPDVVIDATGNAASMERAPRCVGIGGRVVYVGHTRGALRFDNPTLHAKELTLVFSRNATREDFEQALAVLRNGAVDADAWVSDRVGADDVVERLPRWVESAPPITKAVVDWGASDHVHEDRQPRQRGSAR